VLKAVTKPVNRLLGGQITKRTDLEPKTVSEGTRRQKGRKEIKPFSKTQRYHSVFFVWPLLTELTPPETGTPDRRLSQSVDWVRLTSAID